MTAPEDALYQELAKRSEELGYRDKFRLAQLLIQLARKEEEPTYPQERADAPATKTDPDMIQYVADRLVKLKPNRRASLLNSIGAMFQFQGSVFDADRELIVSELQRRKVIAIDKNNQVTYTHST